MSGWSSAMHQNITDESAASCLIVDRAHCSCAYNGEDRSSTAAYLMRLGGAVQQKAGDRGSLARASGDYCIVVAHNPETGVTRIKLPSGSKKVRPQNSCRLPSRLLSYTLSVTTLDSASKTCHGPVGAS